MNTFQKIPGLFAALLLLMSSCNLQGPSAQRANGTTPEAPTYQTVLGKSVNDEEVSHFLASHDCSPVEKFHLCKDVGIALWMDSNQVVKTVWLYSGNEEGFRRYRGKLPFGLTFYDPMWLVVQKLGNLEGEDRVPITSTAGLPDEGHSPDHRHYWAVYNRFNLIVIYDLPFADEDAYIYAILVNG